MKKTPSEKAEDLINKFRKVGCASFEEAELNSAIQSSCLCVDEILVVVISAYSKMGMGEIGLLKDYIPFIYWNDVKEELIKYKI